MENNNNFNQDYDEFDPDYFKCPRCNIYMLRHDDLRILNVMVCSDCYYDLQEQYFAAYGVDEPPKYISTKE